MIQFMNEGKITEARAEQIKLNEYIAKALKKGMKRDEEFSILRFFTTKIHYMLFQVEVIGCLR